MYSTTRIDRDWLRPSLGVVGLFASLGIGLLILAFGVANALKNVNFNDPAQANATAATYLVGVLPLIAGPVLAAVGGLWAGTRAREAGFGALAGAVGSLVGVVVLGLLVALGFAMGASAAGVDLTRIAWPTGFYLRPGWRTTLADVGTGAGLLYLIATAIVGALAGATAGWVTGRHVGFEKTPTHFETRREIPRI